MLRVGLCGFNGHQIQGLLKSNPRAKTVAVCYPSPSGYPDFLQEDESVKKYLDIEAMLADPEIDLVSLSSPVRAEQARHAVMALEAGKHVYAEKPCALSEEDLDAIIAAARKSGKTFREMAGTAFEQPYIAMREVVDSGVLGEIVQVFAQKSYPYHDNRPQDDTTDGGIIRWVGVHAFRFVEHVSGIRMRDVYALETGTGNPHEGDLKMAASFMGSLENGAVFSIISNYLNQKGLGTWGNEHVRIFGTRGFVESVDAGKRTRLVVGDEDRGELDMSVSARDYFELVLDDLVDGKPMSLSLDDELHPTRMVIRAKVDADSRVS